MIHFFLFLGWYHHKTGWCLSTMLNEFTQIWGRSSQKIHYISYVYFPYFFSNPTSQMIFPHNKNPRWLGHFSRFPLVGRLNGLVFLGKNYRKTPSKMGKSMVSGEDFLNKTHPFCRARPGSVLSTGHDVGHLPGWSRSSALALPNHRGSASQAGLVRNQQGDSLFGYGSIPINTIFSGMNIHLPAILMFTRGTRFWHTAIWPAKSWWFFLMGFSKGISLGNVS